MDVGGNQTKAKAKLDKFIVEVGYPNKWRDYSNLTLKTVAQGGTLYANMQQIAKWSYDYNLAKVGKPVDLNEWGMLPQVVNASYSPLMNRIVFPAGIYKRHFIANRQIRRLISAQSGRLSVMKSPTVLTIAVQSLTAKAI
ncbi:metallopeptidase [Actinobacillus equuli]|nr:metallopeptidase [Actinobacillus equuli]